MLYEPAIDKPALIGHLRDCYGYPVQSLTFIPEGLVSIHYTASCEGGKKYFLSLFHDSRAARASLEHIDFTLALTQYLYENKLFQSLAVPQKALTGELKVDFQGMALVVFEYICGSPAVQTPPPSSDFAVRLGQLVARLHRCTSQVDLCFPSVEDYELPFEHTLLAGLSDLDRISSRDRIGQRILRDLLHPQQETIMDFISRLRDLSFLAKMRRMPMVLCHTDITPGNLIQSPQGGLYLVDWDGVMLAPAEADLSLLTGNDFPVILEEYSRELCHPPLSADLFAFYMYRRNLADLTDWIFTILHENTGEEQDRKDLGGLFNDCIAGWSTLEQEIEAVRSQLRKVDTRPRKDG